MLTEKLDEVARVGKAGGQNTQSIRGAGVLATDLDRDGRPSRAGLDAVCCSKLDEIGHTDPSACLYSLQVTAESLETPVLLIRALVGKDQRAIASTVEAVVERRTDGSASSICALSVRQELCCELSGDLTPDSRALSP